jgi:hypothetical protein
MNLKLITASTLAAGLLLIATPAFADQNRQGNGSNDGLRFGAFVSSLARLNVNGAAFVNADRMNGTTTTTHVKQPFTGTVEIGTIGSVNGSSITLAPAINLSGSSSVSTNVVTNGSTKFKGASSTASLTSGENVVIVGTTSTSTPNTIDASVVILLKNIGNFFHRMFWR